MLKIVFNHLDDFEDFSIVTKMRCYIVCVAIRLIRFGYYLNVEDFTINTCIHTLTLEGDGEKLSRHENEGPFHRLPFFIVFFKMDVSQRPASPEM